MMKIAFLFFLISPLCTLAQQKFIIKGKIKNIQAPAKVFLDYRRDGEKTHWDSVVVKNGKFEFSGTIADTIDATLMVDYEGRGLDDIWKKDNVDSKLIYLAQGTTILTGDDSLRHARVTGSKLNVDMYNYGKSVTNFHSLDEMIELSNKFMLKHIDAYVSFDDGFPQAGRLNFDADKMDSIFRLFPEKYRASKKGVAYQAQINAHRATAKGAMAPQFALPDTGGVMLSLASFRGKYVLVDFWASWCIPCRHANPGMLKEFTRYKDKNFTILGVSLDDTTGRDAWLKAIHKDGLTWAHVSDLKGWKSQAAKLYGVNSIPQNFLIDPNGKIIAQNLGPDELEQQLAGLLGAP